jgi:predicted anti-sigma-YlaC factor YlaD
MNKMVHLEAEELMAYLDGELSKGRAAAAAAHLGECSECKNLVDGLRAVSQKMQAWEVAVPETEAAADQTNATRAGGAEADAAQASVAGVVMPWAIADALEARQEAAVADSKPRRLQNLLGLHGLRWAWVGAAAVAVMVLAVILNFPGIRAAKFQQVASTQQTLGLSAGIPKEDVQLQAEAPQDKITQSFSPTTPSSTARPAPPPPASAREAAQRARLQAQLSSSLENRGSNTADQSSATITSEQLQALPSANEIGASQSGNQAADQPMIIRTADLKLTTKELDKARGSVERIVKARHGYIGDLAVAGLADGERMLTATLRVPADQLDAIVNELKALGRVASESQGGQDVTSQYVDLRARLANSRNTEKRLTDLLSQRTGKLSDVLEVEQELDRVRGEIEQMEAQRKTMANQITFATLNLTISEEYKAQLEALPPTTWTRLRNSAVDGYRSMVDGVVGVILFLLSSGPSLLLWAAVLFFPARGAWRMMRRRWATE